MNTLITTYWTMRVPGGVPSHITDLIYALRVAGHHCAFVNPAEQFHSPVVKSFALLIGRSYDVARIRLTEWRAGNLKRKLEKTVSLRYPDVVHAHDVFSGRVAQLLRIPIVLTVHGPLSKEIRMIMGGRCPRYFAYALESEEMVYQGVHRIIAVDSGQKDIIVREYNVAPSKIIVIPNAVNTKLFSPCDSKPCSPRYLLVPRRLVRKNGVEVAIRAMSFLEDEGVQLWIAGDGPEGGRLRAIARESGIQRRVKFLGAVRERWPMASLMAGAEGVIIPSVPVEGVVEATSIAALEAMSCKVPVFASRLGGLAEIIEHEKTGYLFDPGDSHELAGLVDKVIDSPEEMAQVGQAARAYVEANHGLESWVARVVAVYAEALGNGASRER